MRDLEPLQLSKTPNEGYKITQGHDMSALVKDFCVCVGGCIGLFDTNFVTREGYKITNDLGMGFIPCRATHSFSLPI